MRASLCIGPGGHSAAASTMPNQRAAPKAGDVPVLTRTARADLYEISVLPTEARIPLYTTTTQWRRFATLLVDCEWMVGHVRPHSFRTNREAQNLEIDWSVDSQASLDPAARARDPRLPLEAPRHLLNDTKP